MTARSGCEPGFGQPRDATKSWPADLANQVCALYERDGLSTRPIADALGIGKRRADRLLHAAGVSIACRGAGRARPRARHADPPDLPERLRELYVMNTSEPVSEDAGIGWVGDDDRRVRFAAYLVEWPYLFLAIHVMPAHRGRGDYGREAIQCCRGRA